VGETAEEMYEITETVERFMPEEKPRYLMGVGTPVNIIESVARGIDMFDCVMPSRNARHATIFTRQGVIRVLNAEFADDTRPLDEECDCSVCRNFSRAYVRHLFKADEALAARLAVMHNLFFYNRLMENIRSAIENNRFNCLRKKITEIFS
jgi:queuine tRNA-ribosyltransferase